MKKEYVRTEEIKELFSLIPTLKSMKLSLDVELQRCRDFVNDEDEIVIEGMTFGDFRLSDMPFANTNETSDKTANIAINYEKEISNETKEANKAIKQITKEMYYIEIILDKIEIGLKALNCIQKEVLELKYWKSCTWNEILKYYESKNVFYSKRHIQRFTKDSLEKLRIIALIDLEMYKNVIGLINNTNN